MQVPVKHVVFPWWPADGTGWIHPEDIRTARRLIPSQRILTRQRMQGPYNLLRYGKYVLRTLPVMWLEVEVDDYQLRDWVEVRFLGGKNDPGLGQICEMFWDQQRRRVEYQLLQHGQRVPRRFTAEDLMLVERIPLPEGEQPVEVPECPEDDVFDVHI